VTNGIGFELGTDGKLLAAVWSAGVRTVVQDLSAATGNGKQPTDANPHRYVVYVRTDRIFWYIDSLDVPVATSNFQSPSVQTLPDLFLAIAGATPPGVSGAITCLGTANSDTAKNNHSLSDGTYGFRKATIKAANAAPVATDPSLVVALSPNSAPVNIGATITNSNETLQINVRDDSLREGIERTTIAIETLLDFETAKPVPGIISSTPTGIEPGLITRNIPSGTQGVQITDASAHGPAAVKAASTAAVATDPALVTAFSPNSALPSGTNTIGALATGANTIGIVNQGTAATLANAWSAKITDAANGPVAVKPTKTAAATTDPAMVVAASPNTITPIGGTDANGNLVQASVYTTNGYTAVRTSDEMTRQMLEQILLVLIDIRSTLAASVLKGETVSLSTSLDANN
jgi:hypothetical protein